MKKPLFIIALMLSSCVSTTPEIPYIPPPLTNQYIAEVNDSALCSISATQGEPRVYAEIKLRDLDCTRSSLVCRAKGFKKGTKTFSNCKSKIQSEIVLNNKKKHHPAYSYCLDTDFKPGTQAMATCMASYHQVKQNAQALNNQKALIKLQALQEQGSTPSYQPAPEHHDRVETKTECRQALFEKGFNCTTKETTNNSSIRLLSGAKSANPTADAFDERTRQLEKKRILESLQ